MIRRRRERFAQPSVLPIPVGPEGLRRLRTCPLPRQRLSPHAQHRLSPRVRSDGVDADRATYHRAFGSGPRDAIRRRAETASDRTDAAAAARAGGRCDLRARRRDRLHARQHCVAAVCRHRPGVGYGDEGGSHRDPVISVRQLDDGHRPNGRHQSALGAPSDFGLSDWPAGRQWCLPGRTRCDRFGRHRADHLGHIDRRRRFTGPRAVE